MLPCRIKRGVVGIPTLPLKVFDTLHQVCGISSSMCNQGHAWRAALTSAAVIPTSARALWTSHPPLNSAGDWWPPGKAEEEVQSAAGSGAHESQRCRQETHTATEILGH